MFLKKMCYQSVLSGFDTACQCSVQSVFTLKTNVFCVAGYFNRVVNELLP